LIKNSITTSTNSVLTGITFRNNIFVAVGEDRSIIRSTDNGTT